MTATFGVFSEWDWSEVIEGITVSVLFIAAPVIWRLEKHHRRAEERHTEVMAAHKATHDHFGIEP
jgi:hypothetical protein